MVRPLFIGALLLGSTGCLQRYVEQQGLRGKVVDADTLTPITRADVRIQQPLSGGNGQYHSLKSTKMRTLQTLADGTFATKPVHRWWIHPMIIPADRAALSCVFMVSEAGYASYAEDLRIDSFHPSRDVGVIKLRSANAPE